MKKYAITAALLLALVLVVWGLGWSRAQNRLVVANESGQAISFLTITVGGKTIRFTNIPTGASVSAPFGIRSDDHFAVRGQMEDGTQIADDCGYVTNGMYGERASFVIRPGGRLEFKQGRTGAEPLYGL